jgi:hypothetical protein
VQEGKTRKIDIATRSGIKGTYGVIFRRTRPVIEDSMDLEKIRSVLHFVVCTALVERVVSSRCERGDSGWLLFQKAHLSSLFELGGSMCSKQSMSVQRSVWAG